MSEFNWPDDEEEFEEITSDEVDQVVQQLETLMATVQSENFRSYLEEAADRVHALIYGDDLAYDELDEGVAESQEIHDDLGHNPFREEAA